MSLARLLRGLAALPLFSVPVLSQAQGKRPITQDTYDRWHTIGGTTVSPDGKWVAYTLSPVVGNGELVVRSTQGTAEYRVPRGYTGRAQLQPAADSAAQFTPAAPVFSGDSKFVAVLAYPDRDAMDQARRSRLRAELQPKAGLAIVGLADGKVGTVPRVKSFRLARDGGAWLAYLLEGDSVAAPAPPRRSAGADSTERRKDAGTTLVLRALATGGEERIADVIGYTIDDGEKWLAYAVSSKSGDTDGAFVRALSASAAAPAVALAAGKGNYKGLAIDRKGTQVAFVTDRDDYAARRPKYALWHASLGARPVAQAVVNAAQLPSGLVVADRGGPAFTREGTAITFGMAPPAQDSIPADSLAEKAVYDLWHWKDGKLQPQQKVELARDRNRTFTAVWQVATRTLVPLGGDSLPQVQVSADGRTALAVTAVPYEIEQMWAESDAGTDVWLLDATTGARRKVASKVPFRAQLSPGGKYVLWYDDHRWFAHDVKAARTRDLTGAIPGVRFDQETWDTPSLPNPWGSGGWSTHDARVLVYDRYDVWELDPAGVVPPRRLTDGTGRERHTILRVVRTDLDEPSLDASQPLLLSAIDDSTKHAGFWTDRIGGTAPPVPIVMSPNRWGTPLKARKAGQFVVTRQSYREFPDLYTGERLDALARISEANPQQGEYPRGDVQLVRWLSADGVPLRGLLYTPEGFDSTRTYPMLVYFYEEHSNDLFAHVTPTGRNLINPLVYNSLGYLVFMPDIHYIEGYPGPSAVKSIVPGVQSLIARGFVDPRRLGIGGQSWGGYQTAYLVTQTNMFAAAVPNATVANMTSAYGGIRWGSGLARSFQYEKSQSRIGCSIWTCRDRFIENSPLFFADRIKTPLLFMANDNDGAVPWYQGIEFFVALRRLGKEAYMVTYNGDEHNPTKRANQKDIDRKMQDFFGHHLLGQPAPGWMRKGIPMLVKGRDQVRMATDSVTP
ncbi:MAG: S9 family peptidase [Gemmatimonadetes bacterium]|nr:S9 family peptidase [Gemmatimonadota bacterium]